MIHLDGRANRDAFLLAVGNELNLGEGEVEPVVRAVFQSVRHQISEGEAEDIAAQLPGDLAALWSEAS